jgi:hypothetical protein
MILSHYSLPYDRMMFVVHPLTYTVEYEIENRNNEGIKCSKKGINCTTSPSYTTVTRIIKFFRV